VLSLRHRKTEACLMALCVSAAVAGASEWNGGTAIWSDAASWSSGAPGATDIAELKKDGHITLDADVSIDRWYQAISYGQPDGWWWNKLFSDGFGMTVATSFDVNLGWGGSAFVFIKHATLTVGTDMRLSASGGGGQGTVEIAFSDAATADIAGGITLNNADNIQPGDNSHTLQLDSGAAVYAVGGMSVNMTDGTTGANRGILRFSATNSNVYGSVFLGRSADGATTNTMAALTLTSGARLEVEAATRLPVAKTYPLIHVVSPTAWSGAFEEVTLFGSLVVFGDTVVTNDQMYTLQRTALDGDSVTNDLVLAVSLPDVPDGEWSYKIMQASENETGTAFGFWANYSLMWKVVEVFGRSPIDRVGFHKWEQFEISAGGYVFDSEDFFKNDKLSHRCGSTTIASINFGSAPDISPSGNDSLWIPGFYTPRIDDPATRTAATNALYVYVTNRLTTVGDTILIIDYEPMWNYDTTTTTGRTLFSDWFIDAAAVARRAADDIGMSDLLQIAINVNGNPIWAPEIVGGTNATWLLDAAAAADIFTIDTYSFDSNDPTNAAVTFSVLEYWIEHYSLGKPVIVTEVGFQTVLTEDPDYAGGYHAYGTEEQQAQFYENFFQTLETENVPGGQLKGQVRGVALWSFMDQDFGSYLDYFGLVRTNSTLKPAAAVVQSNLTLNADGAVRPSFEGPVVLYTGMTITNEMPLVFDSGTEHGFLRLSGMLPAGAHTVSLHVETAGPGHMMLCANGDWTPPAHTPKSSFDFNLSGAALPGETNTLDLFFTGDFFPCTQTVSRVSLSYSGPIQLALDYAVEMMTVEATGLPAIGTNYLQATTNLVDGEWSPIDFSTGAEVEEWTVSPNVAPVRFFRVLSVQ